MTEKIKILKASAGSGKTFALAKEYIRLLLQSGDPYAYRHILAVTFTNKATDEMKGRILKELDILASKNIQVRINAISRRCPKPCCPIY